MQDDQPFDELVSGQTAVGLPLRAVHFGIEQYMAELIGDDGKAFVVVQTIEQVTAENDMRFAVEVYDARVGFGTVFGLVHTNRQ